MPAWSILSHGWCADRFLLQGLRLTAAGCAAGLIFSLPANRLIENMLYGMSTLDAKTHAAVIVLIILVATIASLLPAWHAAQIEPVRVLRDQ